MRRKTQAPLRIRNGLQWRDGRPRWEPSPASRAAGVRGRDLKDAAGRWIADRGVAISICDGRALWAQMLRDARNQDPPGVDARAKLKAVLEALQPPATDEARLKRHLLQDLVDQARQLLGADVAGGAAPPGAPRAVERLVEAYFAAADDSADKRVKIKPATRKAYRTASKKLLAKFPGRAVASISRMELFAWYHDDLGETLGRANANLTIGATCAFFEFATKLEWIHVSPAVRLEVVKAPGRLVFWTLEEEASFVAWCDANGWADVGDGVTEGLWTGARISDLCAADLEDLEREVWTYIPIKTEKRQQIAKPGIVPQVRTRLARRRAEALDCKVRFAGATPLLWHPTLQRRHDVNSYWRRFVDAKAAFLAAKAGPETLAGKKQQDTRDTCVTRLWQALDYDLARIWIWTGHSEESCREILKQHYLTLLDEGSIDIARKLEAWAAKEALKLA